MTFDTCTTHCKSTCDPTLEESSVLKGPVICRLYNDKQWLYPAKHHHVS